MCASPVVVSIRESIKPLRPAGPGVEPHSIGRWNGFWRASPVGEIRRVAYTRHCAAASHGAVAWHLTANDRRNRGAGVGNEITIKKIADAAYITSATGPFHAKTLTNEGCGVSVESAGFSLVLERVYDLFGAAQVPRRDGMQGGVRRQ